mmetsp:Transcript_29565/g.58144  ORF Transcript_29565/g.58144 Transcript_29565/m.58144 type:complete len:392 (+) Transcript_29565:2400-3575(+)
MMPGGSSGREFNEPLQMIVGVAKAVVGHDDALGDMGQLVLLRHGDATMHLDRLFGDLTAHAPDQVLAGRQGQVARVRFQITGGVDHSRSCLLHLDQQIGKSVRQGLKTADRSAKLLAGCKVVFGQRNGGFHRTQRFGTLGNDGECGGVVQGVQPQIQGRARRIVQRDFGGPPTGQQRIAQHIQTSRTSGHQIKANVTAIAGRHNQMVGSFCVHHNGLAPGQLVARDSRCDVIDVIASAGFAMRQSELQCACNHRVHHVAATGRGQQPPSHQGPIQKRFNNARAAQFFKNNGKIKARPAKAPLIFGKERADHAQFCKFFPDICRHAAVRVQDLIARGRCIFVRQIAPQRILQHLPFFGQVKIHRPPPIVTLAMMPRWISFDPPKIDNLRLLK